jgi:hypothetical protein
MLQVAESAAPPPDSEFSGKSISQGRQALSRFVHSPVSMIALIFFLLVVAVAFIWPSF